MITFVDGPAKGQALILARTPIYLRVVKHTATGKWDALDQLDDTAQPGEVIFVYKMTGEPTFMMACSRSGPNKGCRKIAIANYRHVAHQPIQEVLRDNAQWTEWVHTRTE